MDLNSDKIKFGEELGQNWKTNKDYSVLLNDIIVWLTAVVFFLFSGTLIHFLEIQWSGSPLFFITDFVTRLVCGSICLISGLALWFVTGESDILSKLLKVLGNSITPNAFTPLFIAMLLTYSVFRSLKRIHLTDRIKLGLIFFILIMTLIIFVISKSKGLEYWAFDIILFFKMIFAG